jgi:hypothetical protein
MPPWVILASLRRYWAGQGFTDVDLVEHTWREPLLCGEEAWANILQGTVGRAARTLPPPQQQLGRQRFLPPNH